MGQRALKCEIEPALIRRHRQSFEAPIDPTTQGHYRQYGLYIVVGTFEHFLKSFWNPTLQHLTIRSDMEERWPVLVADPERPITQRRNRLGISTGWITA